jgi:maltooligosyltrehalose trehalohydrolase
VHALLTGEDKGYYADFGGIDALGKSLAERFVYDGGHSTHRRRAHGAPATDVSPDHFIICTQNHDQVGNRAAGERLTTLVSVEQQKLAAALLLLSPYVPMLFMGEEYGETNPFQYFVSHGDAKLVDAVRAGRKKEFEAFGWGDEVPDPQSEETFARSKLDWSRSSISPHREIRALYRDLLRLRRQEPALRPGDSAIDVRHDAAQKWLTVELTPDDGNALLAVFNLGDAAQAIAVPDGNESWDPLLSTEDEPYRAPDGAAKSDAAASDDDKITLPPYTAALFRREQQ